MLKDITCYWWAPVLRGLVAVLFGIGAFIWPGITLAALVLLFGAYALVDGILSLVHAFSSGTGFRGLLAIEGIVGIAAGLVALAWPGITALALLYLIAAWAIVTGILEIGAAVRLRKLIENEWLLGLAGIASIAFGIILAVQPSAGALALLWLIGAYAFVFGVLLIALGFRLRRRPAAHEARGRRTAVNGRGGHAVVIQASRSTGLVETTFADQVLRWYNFAGAAATAAAPLVGLLFVLMSLRSQLATADYAFERALVARHFCPGVLPGRAARRAGRPHPRPDSLRPRRAAARPRRPLDRRDAARRPGHAGRPRAGTPPPVKYGAVPGVLWNPGRAGRGAGNRRR
jgi:uncharacterized membrane protein HdeD (DUF308 family)